MKAIFPEHATDISGYHYLGAERWDGSILIRKWYWDAYGQAWQYYKSGSLHHSTEQLVSAGWQYICDCIHSDPIEL